MCFQLPGCRAGALLWQREDRPQFVVGFPTHSGNPALGFKSFLPVTYVLHGSRTIRVSKQGDPTAWFSSCFSIETILTPSNHISAQTQTQQHGNTFIRAEPRKSYRRIDLGGPPVCGAVGHPQFFLPLCHGIRQQRLLLLDGGSHVAKYPLLIFFWRRLPFKPDTMFTMFLFVEGVPLESKHQTMAGLFSI